MSFNLSGCTNNYERGLMVATARALLALDDAHKEAMGDDDKADIVVNAWHSLSDEMRRLINNQTRDFEDIDINNKLCMLIIFLVEGYIPEK